MDSESGATRELLEILRLAGAEWSDRAWRGCTVKPSSEKDNLDIQKPAFCYFWEAGDSPVEVAFVRRGRVPARKSRTMLIEIGIGQIRVSIPGRHPLIISDIDPAVSERMVDLIPGDKRSTTGKTHSWHEELGLVSAAMRLIVLSGQAVLEIKDSTGDLAKEPSLGVALHDWFGRTQGSPRKLADAAEKFARKPRQLVRQLKKTTGAGFTEHLNLHRVVLARSLLIRTDYSVVEIARECGFKSREPFIRLFNKSFGWTPLQFRKAWRQISLSGEESPALCRVSGRMDVQWLPDQEPIESSQASEDHPPITLVISNALQELVELSRIGPHGQLLRHEVLDSGRMVVVPETHGGAQWHVRAMDSGRSGLFMTPGSHAGAVISSETLHPK